MQSDTEVQVFPDKISASLFSSHLPENSAAENEVNTFKQFSKPRKVSLQGWIVQRFQETVFERQKDFAENARTSHAPGGKLYFPYDKNWIADAWRRALNKVWVETNRMAMVPSFIGRTCLLCFDRSKYWITGERVWRTGLCHSCLVSS